MLTRSRAVMLKGMCLVDMIAFDYVVVDEDGESHEMRKTAPRYHEPDRFRPWMTSWPVTAGIT